MVASNTELTNDHSPYNCSSGSVIVSTSSYRKNSNIIHMIFTKKRGMVARVHIIHVN